MSSSSASAAEADVPEGQDLFETRDLKAWTSGRQQRERGGGEGGMGGSDAGDDGLLGGRDDGGGDGDGGDGNEGRRRRGDGVAASQGAEEGQDQKWQEGAGLGRNAYKDTKQEYCTSVGRQASGVRRNESSVALSVAGSVAVRAPSGAVR